MRTETDFWGDALERWPTEVVANMGLSASDAHYLTTIGLPYDVDWNLRIEASPASQFPRFCNGLPVLAFDGPVPICVDTDCGGVIIAREGTLRRFVNSDVRRFGAFLMLYQEYRQRIGQVADDEAVHVIDEIEQSMRARDPEAMLDAERYWPIIVEQMGAGML